MDALADAFHRRDGERRPGTELFSLEQSSSPSRARLQKVIAEKLPQAKWHEYEPVDFDIHRQAATLAFGKPVKPYFKIDEAKVIVALDSDFIGGEEDLHVNIRQFRQGPPD